MATSIAVGGSFLHRGPFALVRELVRQQRSNLEIIKPSPGYDVDLLCRAGAVAKVRAGIVAMEGNFGLARWYRQAIERKEAAPRRTRLNDARRGAACSLLRRSRFSRWPACTAAISRDQRLDNRS